MTTPKRPPPTVIGSLLKAIGLAFCVLAAIASCVPSMHFHVVFAGDERALKFHELRVIELKNKLGIPNETLPK